MEMYRYLSTPRSTSNVGIDKEGLKISETWDYVTIMGILMYIANSYRPNIVFFVHQCAKFTHIPRYIRALAIKRIMGYQNGTKKENNIFDPTNELRINCYVDVTFAGLYDVDNEQDCISVKSRTEYFIAFLRVLLQ